MAKVVKGDTVKVNYTGRFENGEVFDSSEGGEGIAFETGTGHVIPGFENAIIGMEIGQKKTVIIKPEEGYGEYDEEGLIELGKEDFPEDMELEVGMMLHLQDDHGHAIPVVVKEIRDDMVLLDENHPLAGKTLVFDIELVEIGCEVPKQHHHRHDDCGEGECGSCGCH